MFQRCLFLCLLLNASGVSRPVAAAPPKIEKYLLEGRLAEGAVSLQATVDADPADALSRFGLGVTQFFWQSSLWGRASIDMTLSEIADVR